MAAASIEVSGSDAERWAGELRAALTAADPGGDGVGPVEVDRSAELVIAVIGLVLAGVDTAKTIWDWWHDRQPAGVKVRILLEDGSQIDLSGIDEKQLQIELERRV